MVPAPTQNLFEVAVNLRSHISSLALTLLQGGRHGQPLLGDCFLPLEETGSTFSFLTAAITATVILWEHQSDRSQATLMPRKKCSLCYPFK